MALQPEEIDTGNLAPVFAPSSFFVSGNWPGPHISLRTREIGLTWAVLFPEESMRYVDFRLAEYWDCHGVDWKSLSHAYLKNHTGEELGTHKFCRPDGEIYGLAFMQPDGIGPSRLLLRDRLSAAFPGGYRVALPEMSCGIAFSVGLSENELANVHSVIENCYRRGTRPLAPGVYTPEDLLPTGEFS